MVDYNPIKRMSDFMTKNHEEFQVKGLGNYPGEASLDNMDHGLHIHTHWGQIDYDIFINGFDKPISDVNFNNFSTLGAHNESQKDTKNIEKKGSGTQLLDSLANKIYRINNYQNIGQTFKEKKGVVKKKPLSIRQTKMNKFLKTLENKYVCSRNGFDKIVSNNRTSMDTSIDHGEIVEWRKMDRVGKLLADNKTKSYLKIMFNGKLPGFITVYVFEIEDPALKKEEPPKEEGEEEEEDDEDDSDEEDGDDDGVVEEDSLKALQKKARDQLEEFINNGCPEIGARYNSTDYTVTFSTLNDFKNGILGSDVPKIDIINFDNRKANLNTQIWYNKSTQVIFLRFPKIVPDIVYRYNFSNGNKCACEKYEDFEFKNKTDENFIECDFYTVDENIKPDSDHRGIHVLLKKNKILINGMHNIIDPGSIHSSLDKKNSEYIRNFRIRLIISNTSAIICDEKKYVVELATLTLQTLKKVFKYVYVNSDEYKNKVWKLGKQVNVDQHIKVTPELIDHINDGFLTSSKKSKKKKSIKNKKEKANKEENVEEAVDFGQIYATQRPEYQIMAANLGLDKPIWKLGITGPLKEDADRREREHNKDSLCQIKFRVLAKNVPYPRDTETHDLFKSMKNRNLKNVLKKMGLTEIKYKNIFGEDTVVKLDVSQKELFVATEEEIIEQVRDAVKRSNDKYKGRIK